MSEAKMARAEIFPSRSCLAWAVVMGVPTRRRFRTVIMARAYADPTRASLRAGSALTVLTASTSSPV